MKTIFKFFVAGLALFFSVHVVQAQSAPAITKEYSDVEIGNMIDKYQAARSRDVIPPEALQQKFQKDFPKAYDVEWESAENIYEVEFDIRFNDYKAYYDAKGNLLMYAFELWESDLPANIKSAAKAKYPKYRFEDLKEIHKGSEVFYKIEMERRDVDVKMVIKSDGTFIDQWFD